MFNHSVKVPRLYKVAANIAKDVKEGVGSIKQLVYESRKKHPNIKALYALVATLYQRSDEIESLLKRSQFLIKEPRSNPWLIKVLIVELLWGRKCLPGESTPEKTVLAYEQIFKAHLSDVGSASNADENSKGTIKPRYVRVNTLSASFNEVLDGFRDEGWNLCKILDKVTYEGFLDKVASLAEDQILVDIHLPNLLIFPPKTEFFKHPAYKDGSIVLQDKASCLPVHILGPEPGSVVLDMCAAPGMKTTQLAAMMNNEGTIYAVEQDPKRFQILNQIIGSSGAACVQAVEKDVLKCSADNFPGVQYILVDPSCTGSGMTDHPNFEQNKNHDRLQKLAGFQIKILRSALTRYPDAKRVVYSTCSLFPEENEDVVRQVLETNFTFKLVPAKQFVNDTWKNFGSPDFGDIGRYCLYAKPDEDFTNGFFVAVFERLQEGEKNEFFNTKIFNYKKHIESQERRRNRKQNFDKEQNQEGIGENIDEHDVDNNIDGSVKRKKEIAKNNFTGNGETSRTWTQSNADVKDRKWTDKIKGEIEGTGNKSNNIEDEEGRTLEVEHFGDETEIVVSHKKKKTHRKKSYSEVFENPDEGFKPFKHEKKKKPHTDCVATTTDNTQEVNIGEYDIELRAVDTEHNCETDIGRHGDKLQLIEECDITSKRKKKKHNRHRELENAVQNIDESSNVTVTRGFPAMEGHDSKKKKKRKSNGKDHVEKPENSASFTKEEAPSKKQLKIRSEFLENVNNVEKLNNSISFTNEQAPAKKKKKTHIELLENVNDNNNLMTVKEETKSNGNENFEKFDTSVSFTHEEAPAKKKKKTHSKLLENVNESSNLTMFKEKAKSNGNENIGKLDSSVSFMKEDAPAKQKKKSHSELLETVNENSSLVNNKKKRKTIGNEQVEKLDNSVSFTKEESPAKKKKKSHSELLETANANSNLVTKTKKKSNGNENVEKVHNTVSFTKEEGAAKKQKETHSKLLDNANENNNFTMIKEKAKSNGNQNVEKLDSSVSFTKDEASAKKKKLHNEFLETVNANSKVANNKGKEKSIGNENVENLDSSSVSFTIEKAYAKKVKKKKAHSELETSNENNNLINNKEKKKSIGNEKVEKLDNRVSFTKDETPTKKKKKKLHSGLLETVNENSNLVNNKEKKKSIENDNIEKVDNSVSFTKEEAPAKKKKKLHIELSETVNENSNLINNKEKEKCIGNENVEKLDNSASFTREETPGKKTKKFHIELLETVNENSNLINNKVKKKSIGNENVEKLDSSVSFTKEEEPAKKAKKKKSQSELETINENSKIVNNKEKDTSIGNENVEKLDNSVSFTREETPGKKKKKFHIELLETVNGTSNLLNNKEKKKSIGNESVEKLDNSVSFTKEEAPIKKAKKKKSQSELETVNENNKIVNNKEKGKSIGNENVEKLHNSVSFTKQEAPAKKVKKKKLHSELETTNISFTKEGASAKKMKKSHCELLETVNENNGSPITIKVKIKSNGNEFVEKLESIVAFTKEETPIKKTKKKKSNKKFLETVIENSNLVTYTEKTKSNGHENVESSVSFTKEAAPAKKKKKSHSEILETVKENSNLVTNKEKVKSNGSENVDKLDSSVSFMKETSSKKKKKYHSEFFETVNEYSSLIDIRNKKECNVNENVEKTESRVNFTEVEVSVKKKMKKSSKC